LQQFLGGKLPDFWPCFTLLLVRRKVWAVESISVYPLKRTTSSLQCKAQAFRTKVPDFWRRSLRCQNVSKWLSRKWITFEPAQSIKTVPKRERWRTQARNFVVLQHTCSQLTGFLLHLPPVAPFNGSRKYPEFGQVWKVLRVKHKHIKENRERALMFHVPFLFNCSIPPHFFSCALK
jgi:hypothetical protein